MTEIPFTNDSLINLNSSKNIFNQNKLNARSKDDAQIANSSNLDSNSNNINTFNSPNIANTLNYSIGLYHQGVFDGMQNTPNSLYPQNSIGNVNGMPIDNTNNNVNNIPNESQIDNINSNPNDIQNGNLNKIPNRMLNGSITMNPSNGHHSMPFINDPRYLNIQLPMFQNPNHNVYQEFQPQLQNSELHSAMYSKGLIQNAQMNSYNKPNNNYQMNNQLNFQNQQNLQYNIPYPYQNTFPSNFIPVPNGIFTNINNNNLIEGDNSRLPISNEAKEKSVPNSSNSLQPNFLNNNLNYNPEFHQYSTNIHLGHQGQFIPNQALYYQYFQNQNIPYQNQSQIIQNHNLLQNSNQFTNQNEYIYFNQYQGYTNIQHNFQSEKYIDNKFINNSENMEVSMLLTSTSTSIENYTNHTNTNLQQLVTSSSELEINKNDNQSNNIKDNFSNQNENKVSNEDNFSIDSDDFGEFQSSEMENESVQVNSSVNIEFNSKIETNSELITTNNIPQTKINELKETNIQSTKSIDQNQKKFDTMKFLSTLNFGEDTKSSSSIHQTQSNNTQNENNNKNISIKHDIDFNVNEEDDWGEFEEPVEESIEVAPVLIDNSSTYHFDIENENTKINLLTTENLFTFDSENNISIDQSSLDEINDINQNVGSNLANNFFSKEEEIINNENIEKTKTSSDIIDNDDFSDCDWEEYQESDNLNETNRQSSVFKDLNFDNIKKEINNPLKNILDLFDGDLISTETIQQNSIEIDIPGKLTNSINIINEKIENLEIKESNQKDFINIIEANKNTIQEFENEDLNNDFDNEDFNNSDFSNEDFGNVNINIEDFDNEGDEWGDFQDAIEVIEDNKDIDFEQSLDMGKNDTLSNRDIVTSTSFDLNIDKELIHSEIKLEDLSNQFDTKPSTNLNLPTTKEDLEILFDKLLINGRFSDLIICYDIIQGKIEYDSQTIAKIMSWKTIDFIYLNHNHLKTFLSFYCDERIFDHFCRIHGSFLNSIPKNFSKVESREQLVSLQNKAEIWEKESLRMLGIYAPSVRLLFTILEEISTFLLIKYKILNLSENEKKQILKNLKLESYIQNIIEIDLILQYLLKSIIEECGKEVKDIIEFITQRQSTYHINSMKNIFSKFEHLSLSWKELPDHSKLKHFSTCKLTGFTNESPEHFCFYGDQQLWVKAANYWKHKISEKPPSKRIK